MVLVAAVMMQSGLVGPQFITADAASAEHRDQMQRLAEQAKADWLQDLHPGWSLTQADSMDFLSRLQQVQVR